jgi:DNA-binding GntR family transcriptional regulator
MSTTRIKPALGRPDATADPAARRWEGQGKTGRTKTDERLLTDIAYARIEELIVTMKLRPGTVVSELSLGQELGIGRTPVREALQRLAREQLVRVLPRRGVFVSEIDVKSQLRLLEVRRELERYIARSAARRASQAERQRFAELAAIFFACARSNDDATFIKADREFNDLNADAARNEFAAAALTNMQSLSRRFWYLHYRQAADLPETAIRHAEVAQAIAQANEEQAAKASDRLIDLMAEFTRTTVSTEF